MIAAGDERAMMARLDRLERIVANDRAMLTADYQILRGTTGGMAMQRLAEAEQLLIPGEPP